jgi:RNA polymerase sigma factor (sigma-70 family)
MDVCRREFAQQRDPGREQSINASLARSSVRLGAFLEASQASPSELAQKHEAQLALTRALESLPQDECEMLIAHEMEGESYKQIAQRLGVSAGTVFNRVTAAKRKLMALLAGHDGGGER